MSMLHHQIGRAQRRLMTNVLLENATIGVLSAGVFWVFVLLIERAFAPGIPHVTSVFAAMGLALLITLAATWVVALRRHEGIETVRRFV